VPTDVPNDVPTEPPTDALEANAYAIASRLLGDRPASRAATTIAIENLRTRGALTGDRWLADLAVETVHQSVGVVAQGRHRSGPPDDGSPVDVEEGLRTALRRRLASASDDERAASALHHLAGYDIDFVASAMGRSAAEVSMLAGALAPPPGVSYRLLGDPELVGQASPVRHRRGDWRPALRGTTVVATMAVLALVVAASMAVGARPTLGPAEPGRAIVQIGPDVVPRGSTGCRGFQPAFGTSRATVSTNGTSRTYRLTVPAPSSPPTGPERTTDDRTRMPRGLLVALPGYGQTAEIFRASSGLESLAARNGYLVATIDPVEPDLELNVAQDSRRADDTLHTLAVVDDVLTQYCVDVRRVHAVGFGPGGQLAGALACIRPEVFATASSVSGALLPEPCRLEPPVSLLEVWNADDDVLPIGGGYGPGMARVVPPGAVARPQAAPAADVFARWGDLVDALPSTSTTEADGAIVVDRTGGRSGAAVRSVTYLSGGHAWPARATDRILEFVRDHARAT